MLHRGNRYAKLHSGILHPRGGPRRALRKETVRPARSRVDLDARILAATSREIGTHLREELYYRLSVFQIVLPPLREHKEDIPAIAEVMGISRAA